MDTADRLNKALEKVSPIFKEQGIEPVITRLGEVDIAYPGNEEEYCILGGHAVVMIVAISEYREELPIERAYFQVGEETTVPLIELGVHVDGGDLLGDMATEKQDKFGRTCFENITFWVIPAAWFKFDDAFIAIDFKGERKKFIVYRGPWKLDIRVHEWISKHFSDQIKVAEHIPYDIVANFIEREFFKNNRVQV